MGKNDPNDPDFASGFTDAMIYTYFFHFLLYHANKPYTLSEVEAGLDQNVYGGDSALPAQPASPTTPAFAIIDDSANTGNFQLKLAYWDFAQGVSGSWGVTEAPWDFPFLTPGHVVIQDMSNGTGNSGWNFSMGAEYFIKAPGQITAISFKGNTGAVSNGHRYEILKSSAVQQTQPALSTYSVLQTGIWSTVAADVWEETVLGSPITVAKDEWYALRHFIGGGGQSFNINTLRTGGNLVEDYASINNGIYVSTAAGFPGPDPLPAISGSTRIAATYYGVSSFKFEALP